MAQSIGLRRPPSYLGMAHVAFRHARKAPVAAAAALAPEEPALPWWQQLFPFLAEWLPWIVYYRDLAVYHVQRLLYVARYFFAYTVWMMDRYQEYLQYRIQWFLYQLDERLRRWADQIEGD